jgi:hypothetical protein
VVNRIKYVYEGFIVNYMVREQIHFTCGDNRQKSFDGYGYIPGIKRNVYYIYKDVSVTDLCNAIKENKYGKDVGIGQKDGYPEITRLTVRRCLKRMVNKHLLVKIDKKKLSKVRRQKNKTLYKLHPDALLAYFDFLLTLLTHSFMSKREKDALLLQVI